MYYNKFRSKSYKGPHAESQYGIYLSQHPKVVPPQQYLEVLQNTETLLSSPPKTQ